jgi:hypothetical protein
MLRILGSPKQLCDGLTRRELLLASGLGICGLGPPVILPMHNARAHPVPTPGERGFGQAKNVILLYLFGGPSHLDMLDMKPNAPAEVRGEFRPVRSRLPGCDVCEYLPRMAQVMDKVAVVRSLNHPWNFHGMMWATTGIPESNVPIEESQRNPLHWPFLGSVYTYLDRLRHAAKPADSAPDNLILPFLLSSRRPAAHYARPHGAFLGNAYDPLWAEFRGQATRSMVRRSFGPAAEIFDPYLGITPESRFDIALEAELPADITLDRLARRRSLLDQFDQSRRTLDHSPAVQAMDHQRALAFSLLNSPRIRVALDLDRESRPLRDAYGMTLFGQGTLQARRLVEAGCRFVTVIWDEFGQLNAGWDTHVDQRNRLRNDLLPGLDLAFSALIHDLEDRGMLDETLVLVMSEMGRTPRLEGDGRGHWGRAYTNFFAGGGMARGTVVGRTDALGAIPTERPLSAKDILATIYHLLGIDPHMTVNDRFDRPMPLVSYGEVVREMIG